MTKGRSEDRGRQGAGRGEGGAGDRRAVTERALLELSGEVGYQKVTVAALVGRAGSNRDRFYASFVNKDDCYAAAYRAGIERLAGELLDPCSTAASWPAGMRAALVGLAAFLGAEPALAKGLLAEVRAAGGAAPAKRKEVFERLSRAIDRARRETQSSRHSPPPVTSRFILSAIEAAALRSLAGEEPGGFDQAIAGLLYIAVVPYFGEAAARAEVRRLG